MRFSNISWTDHTWNPWRGCEKVSPGCDHCYAEAMSRRNPKVLGMWGQGADRPFGSTTYMTQPLIWNSTCVRNNRPDRVFCASLADVFEVDDRLIEPRSFVMYMIMRTPSLRWLILTKRSQHMRAALTDLRPYTEVVQAMRWAIRRGIYTVDEAVTFSQPIEWSRDAVRSWSLCPGVTVENQEYADFRLPDLIQTPGLLRWVSVEPLLEHVEIERHLESGRIGWVIVGGESTQGKQQARVCWLEAIESVVEQCKRHGVPVFVKQLGSNPRHGYAERYTLPMKGEFADPTGKDIRNFPTHLQLQEVPAILTQRFQTPTQTGMTQRSQPTTQPGDY